MPIFPTMKVYIIESLFCCCLDSETHFKVVVVSDVFDKKPLVQVSFFFVQINIDFYYTNLTSEVKGSSFYNSFSLSFYFKQRHRLVNETLKEELSSGVHALSIQVCFLWLNNRLSI